jgi:hypothetical protein
LNQKSNIDRIELEYDEFYTQINELNRISELPDQIDFKVSPVAKWALLVMIIGAGLTRGIFSISAGRSSLGVSIIIGSIAFYLLLYFFSHKPRDKKYIVSKKGLKVNDSFFSWNEIDDLHLSGEHHNRGQLIRICFLYHGVKKEFSLDSMTKSTSEIGQILYMYQRWWIKNTTNSR